MSKPTSWFQVLARGAGAAAADADTAEVLIYGDIGQSWFGESVTAKALVEQLQGITARSILIRINSYGGSVADGLAIYNALRSHGAQLTARVEGVAVSIASLIAMAGDRVEIGENAMFMVHAPWGGVMGNAVELREYADVLDVYARAMATSYARKTGKPYDECLALVSDGKDHWYTATDAVAFGLADAVTGAVETDETVAHARSVWAGRTPSFNPAAFAAHTQESPMFKNRHRLMNAAGRDAGGGQPAPVTETPATVAPAAAATASATAPAAPTRAEIEASVKAAETARRTGVRAAFKPFAQRAGVAELEAQCLDDMSVSPAAAGEKLLALLAKEGEPLNGGHRIEAGTDERDHFRAGMTEALLYRASPTGKKLEGPAADFRGMRLIDMARESCERAGIRAKGRVPGEIARAALHSTSDFPLVLENVITKTLRKAYEGTMRTFVPFCSRAVLPDFKEVSRAQLGGAPGLARVLEGAEYTYGTIGEAAEKYSVAKYGKVVGVTWETIINDDLQAFTRLPMMFGRSAADLESDLVWAVITANANLADGQPLFTNAVAASGANAAIQDNLGTAGAISVTTLTEGRKLMLLQKGIEGRYITVRPEFIMVPPSQLTVAQQQIALPIQPTQGSETSPFTGTLNIICEPRLEEASATAWYLAANPNAIDTIEYAYLEGYEGVFTETMQGFERDGVMVKCRHVFGAKAIDRRGLFKNAGA